jgi:hypothetical protein
LKFVVVGLSLTSFLASERLRLLPKQLTLGVENLGDCSVSVKYLRFRED